MRDRAERVCNRCPDYSVADVPDRSVSVEDHCRSSKWFTSCPRAEALPSPRPGLSRLPRQLEAADLQKPECLYSQSWQRQLDAEVWVGTPLFSGGSPGNKTKAPRRYRRALDPPWVMASIVATCVACAGLDLPASGFSCRKSHRYSYLHMRCNTKEPLPCPLPLLGSGYAVRDNPQTCYEGGRQPFPSGTPITPGARNSGTSGRKPDHQMLV